MTAIMPALEGRGLSKSFSVAQGGGLRRRRVPLPAVRDVSLKLEAGKVLALVGESGSGKSTVARLLARVIRPDAGEVLLEGRPGPSGRPRSYAAQVQLILQDPFASLNPIHRVGYHLERPLRIHRLGGGDIQRAVAQLLERVALEPADDFISKYPHELSGGQRQRLAIARALAVQPRVLIADEPVSMLDVSIRLGVLNLLADLRDREGLAILYVTHDIASARYLADTIAVMYAGQVLESGPSARITDHPAHPYTELLLAAAPDPERPEPPRLGRRSGPPAVPGELAGCPFEPRCPHAMAVCRVEAPPQAAVAPGHLVHCWLHSAPPGAPTGSDGSSSNHVLATTALDAADVRRPTRTEER